MKVLIPDISLTGHHPTYLVNTIAAFRERGDDVTVALPDEQESLRFARDFGQKHPDVAFTHFESRDAASSGSIDLFISEFRLLQRLKKLVASSPTPYDLIFFPYLDCCAYALAISGRPFDTAQVSGIVMRPKFHLGHFSIGPAASRQSKLKERLFRRLLKRDFIGHVFTIDPLLARYLNDGANPSSRSTLSHLPDPANHIEDASNAAEEVPTPPHRPLKMLVYGAINERKNVRQLLSALLTPGMSAWSVTVCGRQAPSIKALLAQPEFEPLIRQGRIDIVDRYVDEAEEHRFFAATDSVWVAYEGHDAMSGVLVLAGRYGKPVLARKQGLIGWYVSTYGVGLFVDQSPESVTNACMTLQSSQTREQIGQAGKLAFADHSWDHFGNRLRSATLPT